MAGIREFTDDDGARWSVRAVEPAHAARRQTADRREPDRAFHGRRHDADAHDTRRTRTRTRTRPTEGPPWLVVQSHRGKRRLLSLPEHWELASDEELAALCRQGRPTPLSDLSDLSNLSDLSASSAPGPLEHGGT